MTDKRMPFINEVLNYGHQDTLITAVPYTECILLLKNYNIININTYGWINPNLNLFILKKKKEKDIQS